MPRLQWRDFERLAKTFYEQEFSTTFLEQTPLPLSSGETHKFDLVSADGQIAIQCKSHTWTKSGNYPSAKITDAQRAIELLHKARADRKIIVFQDDLSIGKSLVEVFVRRNAALIAGIEVWRYLNGKFEMMASFSKPRANLEEEAVIKVVEVLLSALKEAKTARLGIPAESLAEATSLSVAHINRLAPLVCDHLSRIGMAGKFDGDYFRVERR